MACPLCSSESGRALREALSDAPVAVSLFAMLLPFLILAVAVVWIQPLIAATTRPRTSEPSRHARGSDEPAR